MIVETYTIVEEMALNIGNHNFEVIGKQSKFLLPNPCLAIGARTSFFLTSLGRCSAPAHTETTLSGMTGGGGNVSYRPFPFVVPLSFGSNESIT